jgi:Putative beta-lactamase-inhibitor-like, PepSY-like
MILLSEYWSIFAYIKIITMKKTIGLLLAVAFLSINGLTASAQFRKIPAEVTDAFSQKFPGATKVEWKDKLTGYSANFELNNESYLVNYNNKAEWESTEQEIDESDLPSEVKSGYDKSKYAADWTISKVEKIELPRDEIQYRLQIANGDIKKRNLYYNSDGRLLKDKLTI